MQVELLHVQTEGGLRLDGALYSPDDDVETAARITSLDALLLLHGTGSNFYSGSLLNDVAAAGARWGIATLVANTRGHDCIYAAYTSEGRRMLGGAYEVVDDCRLDVAAWLRSLTERGYRRLGIVGHSLGGLKAIYSQAHEPHDAVRAVIGVSPPRLAYSHFCASPRAGGFEEELQQAQALVEAGEGETLMEVRFPLPFTFSARSYVDKYGPEERYDLLKFVGRVQSPMLFTYGSAELVGMAFRGLPEELETIGQAGTNLQVAVVAGADHVYSDTRAELLMRVERWLRKLPA